MNGRLFHQRIHLEKKAPFTHMKPLVALSAQTEIDPRSYAIRIRYVDYLAHAGALCAIVPPNENTGDLEAALDRCDGLFVGGGPDVWPELYGAPPPADATPYHRLRDESEIALIRHAAEEGMPVFAVCRGMQLMNVALGGTLHDDIRARDDVHWHADANEDPIFAAHDVELAEDGMLANMLGPGPIAVNSMHHQAIAEVGDGLIPDALGPSVFLAGHGRMPVIEALRHPDRAFFLGVQWHPEYCLTDVPSLRIAEAFVDACLNYHRAREARREP